VESESDVDKWIVVDSKSSVHGAFKTRTAVKKFYDSWYGPQRKGESWDAWHSRQRAFLMITKRSDNQ